MPEQTDWLVYFLSSLPIIHKYPNIIFVTSCKVSDGMEHTKGMFYCYAVMVVNYSWFNKERLVVHEIVMFLMTSSNNTTVSLNFLYSGSKSEGVTYCTMLPQKRSA